MHFHSAQAAETALLLDKAMIIEKPITIRAQDEGDNYGAPPLDEGDEGGQSVDVPNGDSSTGPARSRELPFESDDDELPSESGPLPGSMPTDYVPRSPQQPADEKLAVILSLIAAGYELGQRALDYIAATQTAQAAAAAARSVASLAYSTASEIAERHGVREQLRAIDERHGVTEKASAVRAASIEAYETARATAAPIAADAARATVVAASAVACTVSTAAETAAPVVQSAVEAATPVAIEAISAAGAALHTAVENASPVVQDVRERVSNTVAQQLDDDTVQERLQSARARLADVKSWAFTMLASTVDRAQEAWNGGTDAAGEGATRAPAPPPERAPAPGYGGL